PAAHSIAVDPARHLAYLPPADVGGRRFCEILRHNPDRRHPLAAGHVSDRPSPPVSPRVSRTPPFSLDLAGRSRAIKILLSLLPNLISEKPDRNPLLREWSLRRSASSHVPRVPERSEERRVGKGCGCWVCRAD